MLSGNLSVVGLALACTFSALAQTTQSGPAQPTYSTCSVQKTENPDIPDSEFKFSGKVRTNENFECAFLPGLIFKLVPNMQGWDIQIHNDKSDDNLAIWSHWLIDTPVLDDPGPTQIDVLDFLAHTKTGKGNPKQLPEEHKFIFSPDDMRASAKTLGKGEFVKRISASGNGIFKVVELRAPDAANPEIVEMLFEVDLHAMAVDGFPVYRASSVVQHPNPTYQPDPEYSNQARRDKVEGTVVVFMIVDREGHPRNIRVVRSLGSGLDEQAIETARTWRFDPGTRYGEPVPVQLSAQFSFRLYHHP